MNESDISWTDYTWNPVHGCSKVSSGCRNCYAETISRRFGHTDHPWTDEHAAENVTVKPGKLDEPVGADPGFVFVNSMSDLFHPEVPYGIIKAVFQTMRNTPEHVYQILTKRPKRAAHIDLQWPANVWMGTSVEDTRVVDRLDWLRPCPAETLFVSFEPLIGPITDPDLSGYEWAIVGGETAPDEQRREMDHEWARSLYQACQAQDVAFYFKQSSGRYPERGTALELADGTEQEIREMPNPPESTRLARIAATHE